MRPATTIIMRYLVVLCFFIVSDGFMRWSLHYVRFSHCIASSEFTTPKIVPSSLADNNSSLNSELHQQQDGSNGESTEKEMLLLPAAKPDSDTDDTSGNNDSITQIQLDGEAVPLRDLGPIIINRDGTTRRITNWMDLTPTEQESSWRVIAERNKRRLVVLKQKLQEQKQQQQQSEADVDFLNDNEATTEDSSSSNA